MSSIFYESLVFIVVVVLMGIAVKLIAETIIKFMDNIDKLRKKNTKYCEDCGTILIPRETLLYDKFTGHPTWVMTSKYCPLCGPVVLRYTEKKKK